MTSINTECRLFRCKLLEAIPKFVTGQKGSHAQQLSQIRLHRDVTVADFTLPVKCLNLDLETNISLKEKEDGTHVNKFEGVLNSISETSQSWPFKVAEAKLHSDRGILLRLDRLDTFKKSITKYGTQNPTIFSLEEVPSFLIVSASGRKKDGKNHDLEERNQLRCQLVSHHLQAVIKYIRLQVKHLTMPEDVSPTVHRLTEQSCTSKGSSERGPLLETLNVSQDDILQTFVKKLKDSLELRVSNLKGDSNINRSTLLGETDADGGQKESTSTSVKMEEVLQEQNFTVGGQRSDFGDIEVLSEDGSPSRHLKECAKLESEVFPFSKEVSKGAQVIALHISTPSQSHHQKRVELLWRSVSEFAKQSIPAHITLGPVSIVEVTRQSELGSLASIVAHYESELREASASKYGDDFQDNEREIQKRSILAKAAIKFDILSTSPGSTVKLDFSPRDQAAESRPGIFVLYNYARLASIFSKFESQVERGIYPPLPPVEEVSFDCLREDEEWKLLLHYVMQFPDVVAETLGNICTITPGQRCSLNSNRVCRFLYSLSRDLSVYYSRTHILVEPRPHLLPIVFARLHLLKTVMKVMADGLGLLDIEPLNQM